MKRTFTQLLILISLLLCSKEDIKGQTVQGGSWTIINNLPARIPVFSGMTGLQKTSNCGTDTVNYTYNKATLLSAITLNSAPSGNVFAQWYPSPQAITVHGFEFYAWQSAMSGAVVSLTCRVYNAGIDSMPVGSPVASVVVNVDSSFGGGMLSVLRKRAIFPSPVTMTSTNGYVLCIETTSSTNVAVVTNGWTTTPPNGRSEWLSSVRIGTTFIRSYNVNIGTVVFNADFIMQPFVSYSLTAGFTPSQTCLIPSTPITFTNTSSPVLLSRFYNTRAFFNIPQFSCLWDYGDSSGSYWTVHGSHAFNYNVTYRVKLTDTLFGWMNGCGDTYQRDIHPSPDPTSATNNGPICAGATLNLYADSVIGATGYAWTGPNGFTSNLRNPVIPSAGSSAGGLYSVFTTIGACSSTVATTYATVLNSFSANATSPVCAGQTLYLSATQINGATYSWTGPNGFTSNLQSPARPSVTKNDSGIYSATITMAGCGVIGPLQALAVVIEKPDPPVAGNNGPLCVGQNLSLTATGPIGATYNWVGPNNFNSIQQNPVRPSAANTFAGTYNVVVTHNGCTSLPGSTNVVVNNNPPNPVAGNNGPVCTAQNLSLTASLIPGAKYTWSGPNGFSDTLQNPTRTSLSLSDGGTYSVVATLNGCPSQVSTTNVVITTNTPAPAAGGNGPLCPGQDLQLTASAIPGATYNWTGPKNFSSNSQNPLVTNINDSNAGLYSVTATTSACGTSTAATVSLVVNTLPQAPNLGNNGPLCVGQNLNLTASMVTGANYFWTGPSGFSSSSQNPTITSITKLKAGIYSAYVVVPGCGTSGTSTTEVTVHAVPQTPFPLSNAPICLGDSLRLSCSIGGVGPNAIFSWTGPNNFSATGKNLVLGNILMSDAGQYQLTATDSGCTSNAGTINIQVRNLPVAPVPSSNGPICSGANLNLTASAVSGATYSWTGPDNFSSNAQNPTLVNAENKNSGVYTVRSFAIGCYSVPASLNVLVNALPEAPVAGNSSPACVGDDINLTAATVPGASYNWSGPGYSSLVQNPILVNATKSMAGSYAVSVTVNNCTSPEGKTDVVVNSNPEAPQLSSLPVSSACTGDSLRLYANFLSEGIYSWEGPLGFSSDKQNPVLFINNTAQGGNFIATVSKSGCVSPKSTLTIQIHGSPNTSGINGNSSVSSNDNLAYNVTGSSGSTFDWVITGGTLQTGAGTNAVTILWGPQGNGSIAVTETNSAGCKGITQNKNIIIGPASGVDNTGLELSNLRIFPNPSHGIFRVEPEWNRLLQVNIQLVDLAGRKVRDLGTHSLSAGNGIELNAGNLNAGVYLLMLENGDDRITRKLILD